jgi:hypothetical protein
MGTIRCDRDIASTHDEQQSRDDYQCRKLFLHTASLSQYMKFIYDTASLEILFTWLLISRFASALVEIENLC